MLQLSFSPGRHLYLLLHTQNDEEENILGLRDGASREAVQTAQQQCRHLLAAAGDAAAGEDAAPDGEDGEDG